MDVTEGTTAAMIAAVISLTATATTLAFYIWPGKFLFLFLFSWMLAAGCCVAGYVVGYLVAVRYLLHNLGEEHGDGEDDD